MAFFLILWYNFYYQDSKKKGDTYMQTKELSIGMQKIMNFIEVKKLSQIEFCKIIGINKNTFQNWKNGSKPSLEALNKLRKLIPDILPEDFNITSEYTNKRNIEEFLNKIICGDALQILRTIPDGSIHLVITSPPYNAGHNYENYDDTKEWEDYYTYMGKVMNEIFRILVDGGRLCLNVPFAVKNKNTKEIKFLAVEFQRLCHEAGFSDFEMILWHKGRNENHFQGNNTAWGSWKSPSMPNMRPVGEPIMIFYKNSPKLEGDKSAIDITAEEFKEWTKNVWYIPSTEMPVWFIPNTSKKENHPCPYPEELVERLIKLYSYKDNIILDPFNGIGTTTAVAKKLSRKYIGIDISPSYCKIAKERTENKNITIFDLGLDELKENEDKETNENTLFEKEINLKELVNPKKIIDEPVNRWFYLKESFSGKLVEFILKRYNKNNVSTLLDPFMGAGSTLYKALDLGINSVGFDINPIAVLSSKVKTTLYNENDLEILTNIKDKLLKIQITEHSYPPWLPMGKYVPPHVLNGLLSLKDHIENIEDKKIKDLLMLIWLSLIEEVSNFKKDGNGIKFRENYIRNSEEVIYKYSLKLDEAIYDIKNFFLPKYRDLVNIKAEVYHDNILNLEKYQLNKIQAVITSPPYANCFDYFEVYKVELWLGGFIKSMEEWKQLKKQALRNNLNSNLSEQQKVNENLLQEVLTEISSKVKSGLVKDKNIVTMLNNYFYDIDNLIKKLHQRMTNEAIMAIVVGNSAYGGVIVPTDQIIANLGKKYGYEYEILEARKLRTSSQQMSLLKKEEKEKLRESIVVLKKIA